MFSKVAVLPRAGFLQGIAWTAGGSLIAQGGTFLSSLILARELGKQSYGQLALIQSTVIAVVSIASLGFGITATKYVSQYRTAEPDRAGHILGLTSMVALVAAVCFSAVLVLFAPAVIPRGAENPAVIAGLRLSGAYVLFTTLNGYQVGALVGLEAFRLIACINVVTGVVTILCTWVLTAWFGFPGAVCAQGVVAFVVWLLCHLALRARAAAANITIRYRNVWSQHTVFTRFSIPATASCIMGSLAMWWCNGLLVRDRGYAELAIFSAANNLRLAVLFLPTLMARVTSPMLNHLRASRNWCAYVRSFWLALAGNTGAALLVAVTLSLAGKQILRLFGKDFVGTASLVSLLMIAVLLEVTAVNLYQAIFTGGSLWSHFVVNTVWTFVLVAASRLAIHRYGAPGLAFSYLAAWLISAVLYGINAQKHFRALVQAYIS